MLYAGGGLFIAMTATATMMSGDVARMREQEAAKRAAECAAQTADAPAPTTAPVDPYADPNATGGAPLTSSTPTSDADTSCPAPDAAAGATTNPDGTTQVDPNAAATSGDPGYEAYDSQQYSDPAAQQYADPNAQSYTDPAAQPQYTDPAYADPAAQVPPEGF